jgi:ABC-2 type transport system ATP-binding protein
MAEPIIEVKELTKEYGQFKAVDHISFKVNPGEIFAFLGPNGAGKSTTIKMLTTLIHPSSGLIKLAGYDVTKEKNKTRSAFGIVFQDPSLDDELTAYENMELHAVLYGIKRSTLSSRVDELLELVELHDRRNSLVKTFSGGMKRRLEIARGLLHHPKVLFLDEPTVGLDAQTRKLLWDYVVKLNKKENMTIFMTTHYLEEAELVANRIAIIDHGKIISHGTPAELIKETGTKNLEEAYLKLTGNSLRDEEVGAGEAFRMRARTRRGGR